MVEYSQNSNNKYKAGNPQQVTEGLSILYKIYKGEPKRSVSDVNQNFKVSAQLNIYLKH